VISAATEPLLGVLKYVLLALLYVFFARVLWAVWSEVRAPKPVDPRVLQAMQAMKRLHQLESLPAPNN
jgi:hypothetical protein